MIIWILARGYIKLFIIVWMKLHLWYQKFIPHEILNTGQYTLDTNDKLYHFYMKMMIVLIRSEMKRWFIPLEYADLVSFCLVLRFNHFISQPECIPILEAYLSEMWYRVSYLSRMLHWVPLSLQNRCIDALDTAKSRHQGMQQCKINAPIHVTIQNWGISARNSAKSWHQCL